MSWQRYEVRVVEMQAGEDEIDAEIADAVIVDKTFLSWDDQSRGQEKGPVHCIDTGRWAEDWAIGRCWSESQVGASSLLLTELVSWLAYTVNWRLEHPSSNFAGLLVEGQDLFRYAESNRAREWSSVFLTLLPMGPPHHSLRVPKADWSALESTHVKQAYEMAGANCWYQTRLQTVNDDGSWPEAQAGLGLHICWAVWWRREVVVVRKGP